MIKLMFLILLMVMTFPVFSQEYVEVEINYQKEDLISAYSAGVTHTQTSLNSWSTPGAINNAKVLLENSTYYQNQHIMGWGALNPWPDSTITNSANWDWKSLDDRVKIIRETKGKAVITLCGCPTWMHTPSSNGKTEWGDALEKAPTPKHFDEFAHLSAEVARRYPDVLYFQVWNELKGFWNMNLNRWRYEDYTIMYNMVYDSLKAVNPAIKVGGPYPVMSTYSVKKSFTSNYGGAYGFFDKRPLDVIVYWLAHKKGADFLCVDGGTHNKDGIWNVDGFKAGDKFTDAMAWIKQQLNQDHPLEIWWSEWYVHPRDSDPQNNSALNNAIMASGLIKTIKAGVGNVLIWQPEGDKDGFSFPLGVWTSTSTSDGGKPTFFYTTLKILKDHFSRGVKIVNSESTSNELSVIASEKKILLVNHKNMNVTVRINHATTVPMVPYEVKLIDAPITDSKPTKDSGVKILYSNSDGFLNLQNLKPEPGMIRYSIINELGSVVKQGQEVAISDYSINLSMFPSGVYIYKISYMNNLYMDQIVRLR